jgi:hypothetical protein
MGIFGWVSYITDEGHILTLRPVHIVFKVLFGLCWVVLGYALLSDKAK